jgi:hypothetical protein
VTLTHSIALPSIAARRAARGATAPAAEPLAGTLAFGADGILRRAPAP